jgi:hypothetical protein
VWLSILFTGTWWDDTPRLSFPVREFSFVVDDNVASLTSGLWPDNSLGGDDLSDERLLVLVHVDWNVSLIPVWASLQKVLFLWCERLESNRRSDNTSANGDKLLSIVDSFNNFYHFLGCKSGRRDSSAGEGDGGERPGSSLDCLLFR